MSRKPIREEKSRSKAGMITGAGDVWKICSKADCHMAGLPQHPEEFLKDLAICRECARIYQKQRSLILAETREGKRNKAATDPCRVDRCEEAGEGLKVMSVERFQATCLARQGKASSVYNPIRRPTCDYCQAKKFVKKGILPSNVSLIEVK